MQRGRTRKTIKEQRQKNIYAQVKNERNERVRGLWKKGKSFYAQLDANDGKQYRYKLEHAETVPQAILARQALKPKQAAGGLKPPYEENKIKAAEEAKEGQKKGVWSKNSSAHD